MMPTITALAPTVIKIGGHDIADAGFLQELAAIIAAQNQPVIIVHGGGKEISDLQQTLGITPHYIDGVRVTDAQSLNVVQMMLAGLVNKRLVSHLINAGVDAVGMTGVDRGIIRAEPMRHPLQDMGFTGNVTAVRGDVLLGMTSAGIVPVIAPLCLGQDAPTPQIFNVNADHVAGAVGAAVGAARTVFLTNVRGVLVGGQHAAQISATEAQALIADGTINGGMIPKVQTALGVLERGVAQATITDLHGLKHGDGTAFVR
ncbi:MAG: acetylglutamate kinase [Anaerolineaceae bacterium]|nr:MAG: acetylglutamate kinase [Anaerolineaceae bacterium]